MPTKPLKLSPQTYRGVFRDSPAATLIVAARTLRVLDSSARVEALLEYSSAGLSERTLPDLVQPWDKEKFFAAFEAGDFSCPEFRGITAFSQSGKALEIDLTISPSVFAKTPVLVVVFSEAAQRIRLEEQLRQAQKMESLGMLAGGIAHDFNNLLTIISGYGHMLAGGLGNDPKNRSAAEQVVKASERAAALTRQLLSFSRRQLVQPKVLDLNSLVQGMTPMLRRLVGEHIDLRILPSADLGRVHADQGQIEQVVMNLLVNARDAMPAGGKLLIETLNTELGEPFLEKNSEVRPGHYVMLAVTDTGEGMDPATREKVFEPFFTTKEAGRGTGLGLSMVLGIVKRGGGAVNVYSERGLGTTVKVFLPRADEPEAASTQRETPAESERGWETVLLVEDDEAVRSLVSSSLEHSGYRVLTAGNGMEALRASKQHAGRIHLLITDLVMPDMNGRDVARKLHRRRVDMPVLFMSGYTDATLQNTVNLDRKLHFIGKPFTPAVLGSKVRESAGREGLGRT